MVGKSWSWENSYHYPTQLTHLQSTTHKTPPCTGAKAIPLQSSYITLYRSATECTPRSFRKAMAIARCHRESLQMVSHK